MTKYVLSNGKKERVHTVSKYVGKAYDIDDITYILEEYSEQIPEKIVNDIYFKLLDYVPHTDDCSCYECEESK